jgi:hypothetical protein
VNGVLSLVLPALTLQVSTDAVGVGEEFRVGVEGHRVHGSSTAADLAALWTCW